MMEARRIYALRWTRERAALAAFVCLLAGAAGGWAIRGLRQPAVPGTTAASPANTVSQAASAAPQPPSPAQLKDITDRQAAPLLKKLESDASNPDLLAQLGNLYYDAQQYSLAVDYYARALRLKPADAAVRTDMGTAFWFMGNADKAIAEFDQALQDVPNNPNTLFNLGLVKWKGKGDGAGATAAWEKLLATDPNYQEKAQVQALLAEARTHAAGQVVAKSN